MPRNPTSIDPQSSPALTLEAAALAAAIARDETLLAAIVTQLAAHLPIGEFVPDELVSDPQVQRELNTSKMTLHRYTHDPELKFPPPIKIRERNFRSRRQLEAFKQRLVRAAIAEREARLPDDVRRTDERIAARQVRRRQVREQARQQRSGVSTSRLERELR